MRKLHWGFENYQPRNETYKSRLNLFNRVYNELAGGPMHKIADVTFLNFAAQTCR